MNNIKLKGKRVTIRGVITHGLLYIRKPKHTANELVNLRQPAETLKRRSRNRSRNRIAKASRRRNRA